MSHIRSWARAYYNLSPIFQSNLFHKPGNEALMLINPRLFCAYCISMTKQKLYTKEMIKELVKNYFNKPNYWTEYTLRLLSSGQKTISNAQQEINTTRQRFQILISKFYDQNTNEKQFKELCLCIEGLLTKKQISQLDYYVLDLSFTSIDQIFDILLLGQETALYAIGNNSLQLIEKQLKRKIYPNFFQLIKLLNRIKDVVSLSPQLTNLQSMLSINKNLAELFQYTRKQSGICIRKQALGYIFWLLKISELEQPVSKQVKQDYLFSKYSQNSIQIICNVLQVIDVTPSLRFSELILLNEIVYKLQDKQQQRHFFEHVKRNIQIQLKLKHLKENLQDSLHRLGEKNLENHEWIIQIDRFQIDFKSSLSINVIKKSINKLIENQHFTIILPDNYFSILLRLCTKINDNELYKKMKSRIGKSKIIDEVGHK